MAFSLLIPPRYTPRVTTPPDPARSQSVLASLAWIAIEAGRLDELKSLLAEGLVVKDDWVISTHALQTGNVALLDILLEQGTNFFKFGTHVHSSSVEKARGPAIGWLARFGVDLNARVSALNGKGHSVLANACIRASFAPQQVIGMQLVIDLLAAGADVEVRNDQYRTALAVVVCERGHPSPGGKIPVARLLLDAKADPCARDVHGQSVLMLALENTVDDAPKLISLLLSRGATFDKGCGQLEKVAKLAIEHQDTTLLAQCVEHGLDLSRAVMARSDEGPELIVDTVLKGNFTQILVWCLSQSEAMLPLFEARFAQDEGDLARKSPHCQTLILGAAARREALRAIKEIEEIDGDRPADHEHRKTQTASNGWSAP